MEPYFKSTHIIKVMNLTHFYPNKFCFDLRASHSCVKDFHLHVPQTFNLHAKQVTENLFSPHRVTRTHRRPRTHPWPKPTHRPNLRPPPRTASPPSSRPPILILIRTRIRTRTRTRPRPRTTAPSRPPSPNINSTCTSPHRATVSRTRQTPAARQSPAQPQ